MIIYSNKCQRKGQNFHEQNMDFKIPKKEIYN